MPIRINLLAEAQALEELRRKDPVKRAALVGACLVAMVLIWISSLQVKIMADNAHLASLESRLNSRTNQYSQILQNKQTLQQVQDKLSALHHLASERFLQATLLDAPMHAPVDGIQITHLRTEQWVDTVPEVAAVKEHGKVVVPAKPASTVARVKLILDAKDGSAYPGNEQITRFKETLAQTPYFKQRQISTNNILLKNLSSPQIDPESGKPFVQFVLECQFPDHSHGL